MKTVLFAITMEGFSQAEEFENRTLTALRMGSREFADAAKISCNYKDSLMPLCRQYHPDCLVVNEALVGVGNIYDIVKDIKSELPDIQITMLIREQRSVGDAVLANLAASGIYNWIPAPWTIDAIANSLISPKKMKDVEAYIPKIIDKGDGLAFATKVIEKVEDKIDDLPDILNSGSNNAVKVNNVDDLGTNATEKNIQYRRVIGKGFGFGSNIVPKKNFNSVETKTVEPKKEEIKFSEPVVKQEQSIIKEPVVENKIEDAKVKDNELLKELLVRREAKLAEEAEKFAKEAREEKENLKPIKEDVQEETALEKKPLIEKPKASKPSNLLSRINPKVEKTADELKRLDSLNKSKKEDKKMPNQKVEKPVEEKQKTLDDVKLKLEYEKILFVRALPSTSLVPTHIAEISGAKLVDFNKTSKVYSSKAIKSSIKEPTIPEGYVVGDVVVGNRIENLKEKFDYVIGILPEDPAVIDTFNMRYPDLCNAIVYDRSAARGKDRKVLTDIYRDKVDFVSFVRTDEYESRITRALLDRTLLMDSPEYAKSLEFLIKELGGNDEDSNSNE